MGGGVRFTQNPKSMPAAGAQRLPPEISGDNKVRTRNTFDSVFGSSPSRFEVEKAILDLQRFMQSLSDSKSELDGVKKSLHNTEEEMQQNPGFVKFRDAYSMMMSEPAFQKLVASISCDKAVWEAMLSNKAIQDLRQEPMLSNNLQTLTTPGEEPNLLTYRGEEPDIAILIMRWIANFTKSKILELIAKFLLLVDDILRLAPKEKHPTSDLTDPMGDKVRSSFLLSVVIILIIVATRSQG